MGPQLPAEDLMAQGTDTCEELKATRGLGTNDGLLTITGLDDSSPNLPANVSPRPPNAHQDPPVLTQPPGKAST